MKDKLMRKVKLRCIWKYKRFDYMVKYFPRYSLHQTKKYQILEENRVQILYQKFGLNFWSIVDSCNNFSND